MSLSATAGLNTRLTALLADVDLTALLATLFVLMGLYLALVVRVGFKGSGFRV
jgi:hypothetical protein